MLICKNSKCENQFESKQYNQVYCCQKCSNDPARIKQWIDKKRKKCSSCDTIIRHTSTMCQGCAQSKKQFSQNLTIKEYQEKESVKGKHPSWRNVQIRQFARSWNKDLLELPCENCGYSKHVEICHIKAIKDFKPDDSLSQVNARENLKVLCPNCHWEFDCGLLN